jgi:hypothetical protein
MKPLRDKNGSLTEAAQELMRRTGGAVEPIFKAFCATGHSPREISRIIIDVVLDFESGYPRSIKS